MKKLLGLSVMMFLLPAAAAVTGERDRVMMLELPAQVEIERL